MGDGFIFEPPVTHINVRQMSAALIAIATISTLLSDDQRTHAQRRRIEYTIGALARAGLKYCELPQGALDEIPF